MTNQKKNKKKSKINSLKPAHVCTIATIIALIGIIIGLVTKNPLWVLFFLLPTVIYQTIRTQEGASTKISSILLLIIIILEILLILFNINFDLAGFLGEEKKYIAGHSLPLGDIKIFGPLLLAILSSILIFRTYGPYTKWLSVIIAGGALVTIYLINPNFFQEALKLIINGLLNRLHYVF